MKSKSHHKKCVEKGIVPVPTQIDESQIDQEALKLQCEYSKKAKIKTKLAETGEEDNEEDTDDADEESDEGEPMEDDDDENDNMDADDDNADMMDNGDDIRMEESDETSKDVETSLSSSSSGAGLFSSRPAMCAKLLPDHVSVTATTESKTVGRSDSSKISSSLGTVYGFSSRKDSSSSDKSEGLQSEVAKSLLALAEQKSSSNQGTSQDKVEQPYWLIGEPRVQLSTSESIDNANKTKILPPSSASLPVGNVMVVSPSPESVLKKSQSDSDSTDSSKDSKSETKENLPEKSPSEKPERPKDLFVTVPLGGYMPPMRRTPGVSPKQGQQGSFDLAKLFKLTENAVRNSKQALRIESPAFQFSHPFPNMATITKDGLVVMATSPANNPSETILVTSIDHEINIESEPIKSEEIESKMKSDLGKEDRKVSEEKYATLSENHIEIKDESDDVEFIKEVTIKTQTDLIQEKAVSQNLIASSKGGKFICEICSKKFQEHQQLILHRKTHFLDQYYKCEKCKLRFTSSDLLKVHEQTESHLSMLQQPIIIPTSANPRPFKCDDCDIAFRVKGHLAKHLRSRAHVLNWEHLGKIPHGTFQKLEHFIGTLEASDSALFLNLLLDLMKNRSEDTSSTYQSSRKSCIESGKLTPTSRKQFLSSPTELSKNDLSPNKLVPVEVKQETMEIDNTDAAKDDSSKGQADESSDNGPHLCGICRRGFINLEHLKNHLIIHAELRPYVCEYCDAGFTNAQSLKTHLQSHAQATPYVCGLCGKTFAHSDVLKQHIDQHLNQQQTVPMVTQSGSKDDISEKAFPMEIHSDSTGSEARKKEEFVSMETKVNDITESDSGKDYLTPMESDSDKHSDDPNVFASSSSAITEHSQQTIVSLAATSKTDINSPPEFEENLESKSACDNS